MKKTNKYLKKRLHEWVSLKEDGYDPNNPDQAPDYRGVLQLADGIAILETLIRLDKSLEETK